MSNEYYPKIHKSDVKGSNSEKRDKEEEKDLTVNLTNKSSMITANSGMTGMSEM